MALGLEVGRGGDNVAGMNTQSDRQTWFVLLDGQRRGPLAYDDLTRAAQEGLITGDTPVWRAGWKNWHPARSVKGLVLERGPAMDRQLPQRQAAERQIAERQVIERHVNERQVIIDRPVMERPVIEAPLAPDDTGWNDEQGQGPGDHAYPYAPPQHRETRRPSPQTQDMVALRWDHQRREREEDHADHIFAEEWRGVLGEQRPGPEHGRAVVKASVPARIGRRPGTLDIDDVTDVDYRPVPRGGADGRTSAFGAVLKRAAIGMSAVLVLAGGGWVLMKSGLPGKPGSARPAAAAFSDLPPAVASVPAVMALQRNDPEAFEKFRKRYLDSAANAGPDDVKTLTRNALRKSVKHLLAMSSGDVLLDLTETSLAYLQGLQATSPESCVWLIDDNKGARLTSNLARDLPGPFNREMQVLERIASTNPHIGVSAMSDEEVRPYFSRVINALRAQNVKMDLQARDRLDPSEFAPYCSLVIAFYQAVLDLPREDKINALRNLFAKAAEGADSDLAAQPPPAAPR
jgi:hypothetical protein